MSLVTLPHAVTVTTPTTTTDAYGNTVTTWTGAASQTVRAYVQPLYMDENTSWPREALVRTYRMFTVTPLTGLERITWNGLTLNVDGPSQQWDTPRGIHHYETMLALVEG